MVEITSIILHYNRSDNMKQVIDGIRKQTIKSEIWVWDNSGDCPKVDVDVMIKSNKNFLCQPRVLLTGAVKTKYTFWQDDDKVINNPKLFEYLIERCEMSPSNWIGWNGRNIAGIENWGMAYQSPGGGFVGKINSSCDIINTGVSFFRTNLINQIPINPFNELTENEYKYGDDIWISKHLEYKKVVAELENSFDDLPEGNGLSKQSEHMGVRNKLVKRFFQ